MRNLVLFALVAFTGVAAVQEDVEAKKKKAGELMKQIYTLFKRIEADPKLDSDPKIQAEGIKLRKEADALLNELTKGDQAKMEALMDELMKKYVPEAAADVEKARLSANQNNAAASLKTICTAEVDFRANDRDGNLINDYWTGDVYGLAYLVSLKPDQTMVPESALTLANCIKLIEPAIAHADAAPLKIKTLAKQPADKPAPRAGYLFVALKTFGEGKSATDYKFDTDPVAIFEKVHHLDRYGFAAYPAEYGKTGRMTYITSEEANVWQKDTEGKAPEFFPEDPVKAGWTKLR